MFCFFYYFLVLPSRNKNGLGKKMYPVYQLYMKDGDKFLMAAKKRPKQKTSNYLISASAEALDRDSEHFLGKLRSNFVGTGACVCERGGGGGCNRRRAGKGKGEEGGREVCRSCVCVSVSVSGSPLVRRVLRV